jgi:hypothetical protein
MASSVFTDGMLSAELQRAQTRFRAATHPPKSKHPTIFT